MRKKRTDLLQRRTGGVGGSKLDPDRGARGAAGGPPAEADRPLGHRRGGGAAGFGPTIGGIMHGIDADIFRDPAAVQRLQRDRAAVARTADGTVVGIDGPEGGIEDPDTAGTEPRRGP